MEDMISKRGIKFIAKSPMQDWETLSLCLLWVISMKSSMLEKEEDKVERLWEWENSNVGLTFLTLLISLWMGGGILRKEQTQEASWIDFCVAVHG